MQILLSHFISIFDWHRLRFAPTRNCSKLVLNSMSGDVQQTSAEQPVQRSADPEQSNMASGRRSRSRSSVPHTPTTPTDAGQVSDHDDMLIMRFDCNVIMSSGESLKSFECNEHTSLGWIRNRVLKILTDKQRYWGNSHAFASFRLLRGDWICESDYTNVYRLFPNLKPESCVLTVVILRK